MIKEKIKKNKSFIITFIIFTILFLFPLPFYIEKDGGLIPTKDRIKIENNHESSGNFYMAYVSEIKVNIPTYIVSLFKKDWELIPKNNVVYTNETEEDSNFRSKLLLNESINNAIISSFSLAKKSVNIVEEDCYVIYVDEMAKTDLKVQDKILKINDNIINNKNDIQKILNNLVAGDSINIEVENKNKIYKRKATLINVNDSNIIGVMVATNRVIETNPKISNDFKKSESGSSGGLMLALEIYNNLIDEDISKNRKIAGTGTIDEYGNVGQISGVKFKLKGAYKEGADVFLAPIGENYDEAIKVANEEKINIKIIGVSTLQDAITKLKEG